MKRYCILCVGLACFFSSSWEIAEHLLFLTELPHDILLMRFISLTCYIAFFFLCLKVFRRSQQSKKNQRNGAQPQSFSDNSPSSGSLQGSLITKFIVISCIIAVVAYTVGLALFVFLFIPETLVVPGNSFFALLALFLIKALGAPITVGLVYGYSTLPKDSLTPASIAGISGAFSLYSLIRWLASSGTITMLHVVIIGLILAIIACGCTIFGAKTAPAEAPTNTIFSFFSKKALSSISNTEQSDSSQNRGTGNNELTFRAIGRPLKSVTSVTFLLTVTIVSFMLGFLRNSTEVSHFVPTLLTAGVFFLVVMLSVFMKGFRVKTLIVSAVLFASAGVLLQPLMTQITHDLTEAPLWLGLALFESSAWLLAVWSTRNCTQPVVAAAASRLASVMGHLIGTGIVSITKLIYAENYDALHASSLVIVFTYMVLLVLLSRSRRFTLPFLTASINEYESPHFPFKLLKKTAQPVKPDDKNAVTGEKQKEKAADQEQVEATHDTHYWHLPCTEIAHIYGLTKREEDVLEQLARGRTINHMEEVFILSRNTLKMHIRHIYTKLDIHSKQDVIDLVEQVRRNQELSTKVPPPSMIMGTADNLHQGTESAPR